MTLTENDKRFLGLSLEAARRLQKEVGFGLGKLTTHRSSGVRGSSRYWYDVYETLEEVTQQVWTGYAWSASDAKAKFILKEIEKITEIEGE